METWAGRCSPPERHSHDPQWTRKNPRDRTPHSRKARNFRSTKRGTSCSADRCSARNVSNSEATTLYRSVCSGDRISYDGATADMRAAIASRMTLSLVRYLQLIARTRKKVAEKADNVSGFATSSIRFLTVDAAGYRHTLPQDSSTLRDKAGSISAATRLRCLTGSVVARGFRNS